MPYSLTCVEPTPYHWKPKTNENLSNPIESFKSNDRNDGNERIFHLIDSNDTTTANDIPVVNTMTDYLTIKSNDHNQPKIDLNASNDPKIDHITPIDPKMISDTVSTDATSPVDPKMISDTVSTDATSPIDTKSNRIESNAETVPPTTKIVHDQSTLPKIVHDNRSMKNDAHHSPKPTRNTNDPRNTEVNLMNTKVNPKISIDRNERNWPKHSAINSPKDIDSTETNLTKNLPIHSSTEIDSIDRYRPKNPTINSPKDIDLTDRNKD
jgi:hypothetical protein